MARAPRNTAAAAAAPEAAAESLADFIARAEVKHLARDVVATHITHPDVQGERIHPGTYGGIRLSSGSPSVTYSDGTKE